MAPLKSQFDCIRRHVRSLLPISAFVLLLVLLPWCGLSAETPDVLVELDRQQIYAGESVHYRVMLNHCGMQAKPDMSGFDQFDVKAISRSQIINSQVFLNGRERRPARVGPLYEYQLTPHATGRVQVPAPSVTVNGKTYVGRTLTLDVADIEDQDLAYLAVTTEPESVYPMQPFRIRLTLAVKGLPDTESETDPLQLNRALPVLTIPWADDEQLGDALEPKEPVGRWILPYKDASPYAVGVSINNYQLSGGGGLAGFFGSRQRLAFRPSPKRVIRKDGRGRRVEYWEYVFERTVIPQRAGNISLGTTSLKGEFAARINTRGRLELDPVYAIARAPDMIVKPPPTAGRPASFKGAIGSYRGGVELTPVEASVGDPMTLTVWLRGEGALNEMTAPDLAATTVVAEQFKVYEATEKTEDDTRRFTYSLRPKTAAAKQFPSIPILTYFDVDQERYVTLKSEPIPISIAAASQLAGSEIAMAHGPTGNRGEIGTLSAGIYANVTDLSELRNEGVRPSRWFLTMGGLACLFVVVAIVTQRRRHVRDDTGRQRRKAALGRARGRMKAAAGGSVREMADGISGALVGLVADLCDLSEDGLTSADAASGLASRDVAPALVSRLQSVLETCDATRYASVGAESDALQAQAEALFVELAQELRSRKLIA